MEQLLEASKSCGSDQVCYLLTYICMGSGYVIYLSISIYGPGKLLISGQGPGKLFFYRSMSSNEVKYLILISGQGPDNYFYLGSVLMKY